MTVTAWRFLRCNFFISTTFFLGKQGIQMPPISNLIAVLFSLTLSLFFEDKLYVQLIRKKITDAKLQKVKGKLKRWEHHYS